MQTYQIKNNDIRNEINDLESFINKKLDYSISKIAKFTSFKHRSKVEFLKYFIV